MGVEGAVWDGAEPKRSVPRESSETLEPPLRKKNVEERTTSGLQLSNVQCLGTVDKTKSGVVCVVCLRRK